MFNADTLASLKGNIGIGHVRYSTTGDGRADNIQPISFFYLKGTLALVHNGNIVNAGELRQRLAEQGSVFRATSDSETAAVLIAR